MPRMVRSHGLPCGGEIPFSDGLDLRGKASSVVAFRTDEENAPVSCG